MANLTEIRALAEEVATMPSNAAFRMTDRARRRIAAALRLVEPVDKLMAYLGHHGEVSPKSELADAVMNALDRHDASQGSKMILSAQHPATEPCGEVKAAPGDSAERHS